MTKHSRGVKKNGKHIIGPAWVPGKKIDDLCLVRLPRGKVDRKANYALVHLFKAVRPKPTTVH